MMKKLLILMLVLGMTSASYGLFGDIRDDFELDLSGTTLTVVGLTAGVAINAGVYEEGSPSQGAFSGPGVALSDGAGGYAAGALWNLAVTPAGWNGLDMIVLDASPSTDPVDAMGWFTVQYSGNVGDVLTVYDYDVSSGVPVGTLDVIPEPMTIALLGLGSLFLLRRRK